MASIQSNYELNVAKRGQPNWQGEITYSHLCRIELGAGVPDAMLAAAREISDRFPAPEYRLSLTYWECTGKPLQIPAKPQQPQSLPGLWEPGQRSND
jgi:hypothetical protein